MPGRDPSQIETARTVSDLRSHTRAWRAAGETIGLVPTMGAIHAGHLALVDAARRECARIVVSIFVNPAQFGPTEDLARYPRREAEDAWLVAEAGADLIFAPAPDEMYPDGFETSVRVAGVTEGLEGAHRPGHFEGVATVVAKLLIQAWPDRAYFGEKDYQQLVTVRHMARDLDIPAEIVGVPTVREADGLALSSRNEYLTPAQRAAAPALHRTLRAVSDAVVSETPVAAALKAGAAALSEAGFDPVDYLELRDAETLAPLDRFEPSGPPARLLAAAHLGKTRLIDNIPVGSN